MTKIPSVEERVAEVSMYHHELLKGKLSALFLDKKYAEALTADRTALLTELRDSGLLEEKAEHQDWCKLTGELEYSSCGCWKDHNSLARAIKAHINNLIDPSL